MRLCIYNASLHPCFYSNRWVQEYITAINSWWVTLQNTDRKFCFINHRMLWMLFHITPQDAQAHPNYCLSARLLILQRVFSVGEVWLWLLSHLRNAICHASGIQLKVWLVHKHPSHLGMQLKDPVYKNCVYLRKFTVSSTVAAWAISIVATSKSVLSSEFCTIQVLVGPQNLSALRNSEVSAFRRALKYYA